MIQAVSRDFDIVGYALLLLRYKGIHGCILWTKRSPIIGHISSCFESRSDRPPSRGIPYLCILKLGFALVGGSAFLSEQPNEEQLVSVHPSYIHNID